MRRDKYLKGEKFADPDQRRVEAAHEHLDRMAEKLGVEEEYKTLKENLNWERKNLEQEMALVREEIKQRRAILEERNEQK